ncbi:MAG TPA: F0F1 ATP synthase subunit delta [Candidatus Paceibacterota bacterium]|nr:F0F1 ATP synthase subunit delta [Candidatus Paceibacterota bacterium]
MRYSPTQYAKIFGALLEKTAKNKRKNAVKSFVKMLEENGDLKSESEILYAIEKSLYEKTGKMKKEITEVSNDPNLIGGVKIKIGDTVIDNSIRTRINNLRQVIS